MKISNEKLLNKLKQLPQIPLHIHWDGSIPSKDMFELSIKNNKRLLYPEKDRLGNKINYSCDKDRIIDTQEKLSEFVMQLDKYHIVDVFSIPVSLMQTKENLFKMAYAHALYLKNNNTPYAETRFAPQYHTFEGLSVNQVIGYTLEGFKIASKETGVDIRMIISLGRESDPVTTFNIVKEVLKFKDDPYLVGIDLATEERGNPPEKHIKAFALTFDTDLKRTVHAGEMCSTEENLKNIYTSITDLKANALGHAIPLYNRFYNGHDLFQLIRENNIRIEANPISNHFLFDYSLDYHRFDILKENDIKYTFNPDDPAMWPYGDLIYTYYFMYEKYGPDVLRQGLINAVDTAFAMPDRLGKNILNKINGFDF
ncbi:MAG: hypothetical protein C0601_06635 [Candidatus Muiribacterium halophilum]|uniref:adenosine deaminase n=1 Tax=Muiribacterium halophilum TaxID=2053465 RepID=A0A2N5ZGG0_MUIH1|nr:MAG: hypothetical protein C0601_06635 [Candidatus Muirbacterium halophilum]